MQMPVLCVGSLDIHQMVCSIYNLFTKGILWAYINSVVCC
jgi:hypothetical protein